MVHRVLCSMVDIFTLLGSKGTIEIIAILEGGEQFFSDLATKSEVNTRTLSRRLNELEGEGIIHRNLLDNRRVIYSLTSKGERIASKIMEIKELR